MLGIIPQLLVKPNRVRLQAAHGITVKSSATHLLDSESAMYEFWRPILHAKFASSPECKQCLLATGNKYLLDRQHGSAGSSLQVPSACSGDSSNNKNNKNSKVNSTDKSSEVLPAAGNSTGSVIVYNQNTVQNMDMCSCGNDDERCLDEKQNKKRNHDTANKKCLINKVSWM
jgi:hypothetical protein